MHIRIQQSTKEDWYKTITKIAHRVDEE